MNLETVIVTARLPVPRLSSPFLYDGSFIYIVNKNPTDLLRRNEPNWKKSRLLSRRWGQNNVKFKCTKTCFLPIEAVSALPHSRSKSVSGLVEELPDLGWTLLWLAPESVLTRIVCLLGGIWGTDENCEAGEVLLLYPKWYLCFREIYRYYGLLAGVGGVGWGGGSNA